MMPTGKQHVESTLIDARALLTAGNRTAAAAAVHALLKDHPDDPDALLLAAEIAVADQAHRRAIAHLDALEWSLAERGSGADGTGRPSDASSTTNVDCIDADTRRRASGWALRCRIATAEGRVEAAARTAADLTTLLPGDITGWRLRTMVALAGEDWPTAGKSVDRWTLLSPNDPEPWRIKLRISVLSGDDAGGADALTGLNRCDAQPRPSDSTGERETWLLETARHHRRAGRHADALANYQQLVQAAGGRDAALACECADVHIEVGDLDAAEALLQEAWRQNPPSEPRRWLGRRLASIDMRRGRVAQAGRRWWRMIQRQPSRLEGREEEAAVEAWAGLWVCAAVNGRAALADRCERRLAPDGHPSEQVQQALLEAWRRAFPAVLLGTTEAGKSPPPSGRGGNGDGARLLLDSMVAEAEQTLADAAERHPHYADVQYHLGICRHHLADGDGALSAWSAALAQNPGYLDAARQQVIARLSRDQPEAARSIIDDLERAGGISPSSRGFRIALAAARDDPATVPALLREAAADMTPPHDTSPDALSEIRREAGTVLERAGHPLRAARLRRQGGGIAPRHSAA